MDPLSPIPPLEWSDSARAPPPIDRSIKSLFEFFLDRVSGLWIFGGSGFSLPSGGYRFNMVARPDNSKWNK
jgi:hypothetical protein